MCVLVIVWSFGIASEEPGKATLSQEKIGIANLHQTKFWHKFLQMKPHQLCFTKIKKILLK